MLEISIAILIAVLLVPCVYAWSKYEAKQNMIMRKRFRKRREDLAAKKQFQDKMYNDYLEVMERCQAWIAEGDAIYDKYEIGDPFFKTPEYHEYSSRGYKLCLELIETDYYKYIHRKRT